MASDVLITPASGLIQFSSSAGSGSGQIKVDGDDLVISNVLGDVLLGDGASDVFIGNGTDNVDIVFEQNGEIRDDASGKSITLGSKTTNILISGSNTIAMQKGGGNVGIGKTAATKTLEVEGDISGSGTGSFDGGGYFGSKVGIGTTSPDNALHISYDSSAGEGSVQNNTGAVGLQIENTNADGVAAIHLRSSDSDGYIMYDDSGANKGDFYFKTDGQDGDAVLTLLDGGNVGIGTESPTELLELGSGGRIKVTPGTDATGSILSLANDHDVLFSSQNDSATGDPQQFVIQHNDGATELVNRRGDLILSASGDITLDADGTDIVLKDGGTSFGSFKRASSDFIIKAETADKDILFKGTDGSSTITALTLDMSEAGSATFNNHITASGNISASGTITAVSMSGDGSGLTGVSATLPGGVVSSSAQIADVTLTTAAQTNITSVGTLGSLTVSGDITANGNVVGDGNTQIKNFGGVQDSSGEAYLQFGSNLKVDIGDSGGAANSTVLSVDDNNNKITMTGDAPQVVIGGTNPAANQELTVVGEISASGVIKGDGGISGSNGTFTGTITAEHLSSTDDAEINDDLTVGGDITVGQSIFHDGDTDTKIVFTGDVITFTAGNEQLLQLSEGGQDKLIVGDGGDVDFQVKTSGDDNAIFAQGSSDNVGIGTSTPGEKLEVVGNISASGNYIGNRRFNKTSTTDADYQGDVVYFGGTTSMDAGKIYHYKSDGTWELVDADAVATCDGLLAVALGAASDTNGMLLRGTVTLDHDPGAVGDVLFVSTTAGQATATAPSGNNDIVRVIGYCLDASNGQIWFNPSSTFVEVSA